MLLIDTLSKKNNTGEIPFWFMRQAGRYLPEYRKIRAEFPNFLDFCYTPEAACEVTLQPIRRFDMSAAIIFSDILVIPQALGMDVWFEEKKGPQLNPLKSEISYESLSIKNVISHLTPVYDAIKLTRRKLADDKALIGFCGAPWTLACYMIEGKGSRDFASVRQFAFTQKSLFKKIINLLADAIILHASHQINAGANVIQLFDSWSGVLSEGEFQEWVIAPTKKIIATLKQLHPTIPIIGFPRQAGEKTYNYVKQTSVDALSFDHSISLDYAKKILQPEITLQGNLDSLLLAHDIDSALAQTKHIIQTFGKNPFIFNLAHGIVPQTPVDHVQMLCDTIRAVK